MKFTEETVKAAAFTLSAFCSSQECGTCPFGGTDGNAEIPCLFKSAEPATWFPMALEMDESAFSVVCTAKTKKQVSERGAADALHPANHRIWIPDHSNRSKDAERGGRA